MKCRFVDGVELEASTEQMSRINRFRAIGMVVFLSLVEVVFDTPNRA